MKKKENNIQQYAMYFGTYMGVYWILKFILFPLAFKIPFLSFLFLGLTIGVPFMGYYYLKTYRDKVCGGTITFGRAFTFTLLVYFFASLLAAVAHFVYFQFIDHGFILESVTNQLNTLVELSVDTDNYDSLVENSENILDILAHLTPTDITFDNLSRNVFSGIFLALPTALIGKRSNQENTNEQ